MNGYGEEETPYTSVFQFLTAQDQLKVFQYSLKRPLLLRERQGSRKQTGVKVTFYSSQVHLWLFKCCLYYGMLLKCFKDSLCNV